MAELFGGAFLSSAFQVLFDRLASSYFGKRKRNDDDGENLRLQMKFKLTELNTVLDDAEKQQITNHEVKEWLDELKHVVYQADDLLDEIATKDLKLKSEACSSASLFLSSNSYMTTREPANMSVSPLSSTLTFFNICLAISSMCLSLISTPWFL